jgi:type I restriction enzyme S subunit
VSFNHSVARLIEESKSELLAIAPWWKRVELGAVASILNGYPWKSIHFNTANGEPLIRIRDVTTGRSETRYSGPIEEGYWIHDGDLVVGMDGDFNSRIWEGGRALLNQRVCRVMPDENFYSRRFLAHVLPGYLEEINEATHSITVKHLSSKTLEETTVPLPPLSEQRRIVAKLDGLLSRAARAQSDLDRVPSLISRYKQAILTGAFSGLLTEEWRKSAPTLKRIALSSDGIDGRVGELADLPDTWAWTSMRQIASVSGGLTKNAKRDALPSRVPYMRVANVYANELRLEDVAEIGCTEAELSKTMLRGGDLLIVEGNGSLQQIGRVALWDDSIPKCSHQNHIIRARPNPQVAPSYGLYWLLSPAGRSAIERVASSSAGLYTLSISKVEALPIPICDPNEQAEVVRRIESAFAWLDKLAAEHARAVALLPKLEQALLAKAFRGELVPQDPNDEPASVLLERIRAAPSERKRKPRSSNLPRAPRQRAAMTKSRLDQDVMHQPYLAKHLRDAGGSAKVEDLFRSADLPVTDFYKQLAWEVESGHINDRGALLEAA